VLETQLVFNLGHVLLMSLFGLTEFVLETFDFFFFFDSFFSHSFLKLFLLDLHTLQITVAFVSNANFKFFLFTLIALFEL
jgi:hypothetical protein